MEADGKADLRGDASVLDHGAGVSGQPAHRACDVRVDTCDLFDAVCVEERRLRALLDAEDDTLLGCDADGGTAELQSKSCVS